MNRQIPKDWVEVSEQEFEYLTSNIDWHRDAWCNGDFYYRGRLRDAETIMDNGSFYVGTTQARGPYRRAINTEIGVRTTDNPPRYLINTDVFKPAKSPPLG